MDEDDDAANRRRRALLSSAKTPPTHLRPADAPSRPKPAATEPTTTAGRGPGDARALPAIDTTHVTKTLWPPQAGTHKFVMQHAARLVCVRYRHDPNGLCRYTTVELVVDMAWVRSKQARERRVEVDIAYEETDLRSRARAQGAKWNPDRRTWEMSGAVAQGLDIANRARAPRRR
ncbi:MAG: hypothetical protein Q7U73_16535 [Rubrivivax sp.]|nr:hypothetical protein [Rubrivivax sp.]